MIFVFDLDMTVWFNHKGHKEIASALAQRAQSINY